MICAWGGSFTTFFMLFFMVVYAWIVRGGCNGGFSLAEERGTYLRIIELAYRFLLLLVLVFMCLNNMEVLSAILESQFG